MATNKDRWLADGIGTLRSYWRIGTTRLKDVSGVLQVRNSADSADAGLKASALQLSGVTAVANDIAQFDASGNITAVAPSTVQGIGVYPDNCIFVPQMFRIINVGFSNPLFSALTWHSTYSNLSGLNAEAQLQFVCQAQTYQIFMHYWTHNTSPIVTVSVDGTSLGAIDLYTAASTPTVINIFGALALSAGLHTINIKNTGKNASSGGYTFSMALITLRRVA